MSIARMEENVPADRSRDVEVDLNVGGGSAIERGLQCADRPIQTLCHRADQHDETRAHREWQAFPTTCIVLRSLLDHCVPCGSSPPIRDPLVHAFDELDMNVSSAPPRAHGQRTRLDRRVSASHFHRTILPPSSRSATSSMCSHFETRSLSLPLSEPIARSDKACVSPRGSGGGSSGAPCPLGGPVSPTGVGLTVLRFGGRRGSLGTLVYTLRGSLARRDSERVLSAWSKKP